jgi:hypothetical protein
VTARPPHSDDYLVTGVIWPARACRLIAPYLVRDLRAVCERYGAVDPEVVALVCAMERAGARYTACANASAADGVNRESHADASNGDAGAGQLPQLHRDLLTAANAAKQLGCTSSAVRDAVKHGRLTAVRRSPYLFDPAEVARFATTRRQSA